MEPRQDRKKMYEELTYGFPSRVKKKQHKEEQLADNGNKSTGERLASQDNTVMNQEEFKASVDYVQYESTLPPIKAVHQDAKESVEPVIHDVVDVLFSEDAKEENSFEEVSANQTEPDFSAYEHFINDQKLILQTKVQETIENEIQQPTNKVLTRDEQAESILNQLYESAVLDDYTTKQVEDKQSKLLEQKAVAVMEEFTDLATPDELVSSLALEPLDTQQVATFMPRGSVTRKSNTKKTKTSSGKKIKKSSARKDRGKRGEKKSISWAFLLSVLFGLIIVAVLVIGIWFLSKDNAETEEKLPVEPVQIDGVQSGGTSSDQSPVVDNDNQIAEQENNTSEISDPPPQTGKEETRVVDGIEYKIMKHTVQNNENLTSISRKYFGTTVGIDLIHQWNQLTTAVIHEGQILEVPIPLQ